jgi:adenine phosphoribosyltransferase
MAFQADQLRGLIREVPDHPVANVSFKDITPLLADSTALAGAVAALADGATCDVVAGIEARGFVLAAPVALALGVGFVPIRKPGKLPWRTVRQEYDLEYGSDALEVHEDAVAAGQRVLVVDDVLATGGTAAAACGLLESLGAEIAGVSVLVELAFLSGRARLEGYHLTSLLTYEE